MPQAIRSSSNAVTICTVSPRRKEPPTSLTPAGSRLVLRSPQGTSRPLIDHEVAADRQTGENPPLAAFETIARSREEGADRLSLTKAYEYVRLQTASDGDIAAARHRQPSRLKLGDHATAALLLATARVGLDPSVDALDAVYECRAGIKRRIGRVEAVTGHEDGEQVSIDEISRKRREGVVLADAALGQLFDGNGVVLVHDGHNAVLEKREQRVARVQIAKAVGQVAAREQCLRNDEPLLGKQRIVGLHELALTDGGENLPKWDVAPDARHREARPAGGHCPRCDDYDLHAVRDAAAPPDRRRPECARNRAARHRR